MKNKKKNPIAEKSKKWLMDALLEIMQEKQYNKITIKEISDKAMLSRRTFYRNFNSKDEILSLKMQYICEEYILYFSNEHDLSYKNIVHIYFEFWKDHIDFLSALNKSNLLYLMLQKFNEHLPFIYRHFKGHLDLFENRDHLEYALYFSSGGLWNVLLKWIKEGAEKTPMEMEYIIIDAIRNANLNIII
ncbi:TetR/AcrR family transcriptional regulator [Clostridium tyrobutyricum]|jgi:AcrR family transcriptional regulator|uniref:TetR/AcrR family transcriptional regulator n=1 Tax=Clostridium tyrobutyricum TaxID=1519 RepID=UPI0011C966F2|nr:TetR/AcrR family transcriptional regulator [Clostridium tyrobutyricum]MBV4422097.1 TetR/AcrR family transcriptional regulator [Clostridium tyrobutyricum]MBV4425155.1 TetR/AcrR family transcriptional regulator [Clostridium tyrobutyricum]MBV4437371.1 TetR/AcrR family transcriptional regulator [Clostridium tyrobutyricum]MBV4440833.1 TetR/AcrR family transcriptional regulator [Clostridium tyrobutyricum]